VNPQSLTELKRLFYVASTRDVDYARRVLTSERFSYIFIDPNSAAYFSCILAFFLLFYFEFKTLIKSAVWTMLLIILIVCASKGALIAVLIGITFYLFQTKMLMKSRVWIKLILGVSFCIVIWVVSMAQFPDLHRGFSHHVRVFEGRYYQLKGYNTIYSSKADTWKRVLEEMPLIVIGKGFWFSDRGKDFAYPHSDHLRFIYSYGIIAYISGTLFLFKKIFRRKYLFLVPTFLAFSLNTLIDEQKLFVLPLIFLAIAHRQDKPVSKGVHPEFLTKSEKPNLTLMSRVV